MDEGKLPNMQKLAERGGGVQPLGDDALAGVADGVGVVCHRREPGQAQHLRLPDPRHQHLSARSRHGARASRRDSLFNYVPIATSDRQVDPRRHVVLGHARAAPACDRACSLCRSRIPPEEVPNGEMLLGLPLPDIRGTMGTFYYCGRT